MGLECHTYLLHSFFRVTCVLFPFPFLIVFLFLLIKLGYNLCSLKCIEHKFCESHKYMHRVTHILIKIQNTTITPESSLKFLSSQFLNHLLPAATTVLISILSTPFPFSLNLQLLFSNLTLRWWLCFLLHGENESNKKRTPYAPLATSYHLLAFASAYFLSVPGCTICAPV